MPTLFKDKCDNRYTIDLTLGKARAIRAAGGIDLLNELDWQRLMQSKFEQLDYTWELIKPQAAENGQTQQQFDENMTGEGLLDDLCDAFQTELVFFYRLLGQIRMADLTENIRKGERQQRNSWNENREQFGHVIEQAISGAVSLPLQPGPASTGDPSPSENLTTPAD